MKIYIKFLMEKSSFNSPPTGRCWYCRQSNAKQICFPHLCHHLYALEDVNNVVDPPALRPHLLGQVVQLNLASKYTEEKVTDVAVLQNEIA